MNTQAERSAGGLEKALGWCQGEEREKPDFIIVGAGAAGATLAARLVERGFRVVVVEMGPKQPAPPQDAEVENTHVPLLHGETTEDSRHALRFFIKHFNRDKDAGQDPKIHESQNVDEAGIFYPRAQGVGGCTIHNAMITIAGPSEDWDEIAELTRDQSWRGRRMRTYFERLEQCNYQKPLTKAGKFLGRIFGTGWENGRHGQTGWLETTMSDIGLLLNEKKFFQIIFAAAKSSYFDGLENPFNFIRSIFSGRAFPALDPNHWKTMQVRPEGLAQIPCAITAHGERSSPRERLLAVEQQACSRNLCIVTDAFVTEVVVESKNDNPKNFKAVGVKCLPEKHVYEASALHTPTKDKWETRVATLTCREGGEVILCGGAFNTPQLLMLSGIGPKKHLCDKKVVTKVDLPGVGENLQDRYEVPVIATLKGRFKSLDQLSLTSSGQAAKKDRELARWSSGSGLEARKRGVYATNGGLISIFKRSENEASSKSDMVIFALAGSFRGYEVGWSKPGVLAPDVNNPQIKDDAAAHKRKLTWLILKARSRNRNGYVRLQNNSPFRRPEINTRSFWEDGDPQEEIDRAHKDILAIDQGVQFVQKIMECGEKDLIEKYDLPGIDKFGGNRDEPKHRWEWIRHIAWGHHACGTCKIGGDDDSMAVLDSRFRVRNGASIVEGLRVVDASVFPRIPGFFIVANVFMIAEKAADVLAEDHLADKEVSSRQAADAVRDALRRDPIFLSKPEFVERTPYPAEVEKAEALLVSARRKEAGLLTRAPEQ